MESDYDLHTVHRQLEDFRHKSNGPVRAGKSGGVTLYWLSDDVEDEVWADQKDISIENLLERVEQLEHKLQKE